MISNSLRIASFSAGEYCIVTVPSTTAAPPGSRMLPLTRAVPAIRKTTFAPSTRITYNEKNICYTKQLTILRFSIFLKGTENFFDHIPVAQQELQTAGIPGIIQGELNRTSDDFSRGYPRGFVDPLQLLGGFVIVSGGYRVGFFSTHFIIVR